jgi:hypothetical protein
MARLVHLNGPPGIGESTLSALYPDRNPGTLNLDVNALHHRVGGWQDQETDMWPVLAQVSSGSAVDLACCLVRATSQESPREDPG